MGDRQGGSNSALTTDSRRQITLIAEMHLLWKMTLQQLQGWRKSVMLMNHVVEEYFNNAVHVAEIDIQEAQAADDEEQADTKLFKFPTSQTGKRDLYFLRELVDLNPYSPPGRKGAAFAEVARILKVCKHCRDI